MEVMKGSIISVRIGICTHSTVSDSDLYIYYQLIVN